MFADNNVVAFPRKKRKSRRNLMETPPYRYVIEDEDVTCFVGDDIPPAHRVEYMERYIRKQGLISSILMDERGEIIGGLDLLKRHRKAHGSIMVLVVPFTRKSDKEALQQAYENLKTGGTK